MTTEVLITLQNSIDANLVKNQLENHGIESFLVNENFSTTMPIFYNILGGGVQVVVRSEDLLRAKEIIKQKEDLITCPSCGSSNLEMSIEKPRRKWTVILASIFLAGLVGNLLNDYKCKDCLTEFRR